MFYVSGGKGNKYAVTDTKDRVKELYTAQQLFDICSNRKLGIKILGVDIFEETISVIKIQLVDFEDLVNKLKALLKRNGVAIYNYEEELYDEYLQYSLRFIGGDSAWYGDEDKCDADHLDSNVITLIRKSCDDFTRFSGVKVRWNIDEKGWSTFHFM